jgi:hypothetical protein
MKVLREFVTKRDRLDIAVNRVGRFPDRRWPHWSSADEIHFWALSHCTDELSAMLEGRTGSGFMGRGFIALCGSTPTCAKNSLRSNIRFGILDVPFGETLKTRRPTQIQSLHPSAMSCPCLSLKIESVSQDHFSDQVVGRAGHTHAQSEVQLPLGRQIQIDRGKNLVLLLR